MPHWDNLFKRFHKPVGWEEYRDIAIICLAIAITTGTGLFLIWSITYFGSARFIQGAVGCAMLWAIAYLSLGFLIGFLFGIPRVIQPGTGAKESVPANVNKASAYSQQVNTNLEQISDWLTKIIVGLGLVELQSLPDLLRKASSWIAQGLSNGADAGSVVQATSLATSIILFFSVVGFLAGYLITRLFFAGAFGRADSQEILKSTFHKQDSTNQIRMFWMPSGLPNPMNEKMLLEWLSRNKIDVSLASFINGAKFEVQRNKMIQDLNIS
jgi:hypothetical protein